MPFKFNPTTAQLDLVQDATTVATIDTKANILALSPTEPQVAFATDTSEFFLWDGSDWQIASLKLNIEEADPDMGWTQDNDKNGYGETYIEGKKATSFGLGDFSDTEYNGAMKLDQGETPMTLEIYARDQWNRLFYDLQMVNGDFEHKPTDNFTIDVRSGNSNEVGLNGVPIVQEYGLDMGCYPYPTVISGGEL